MPRVPREWVTPLTIGAFVLMSVTGGLMFFHVDRGLNQAAHEWLGWALVAGGTLHAVANAGAIRSYFTEGAVPRVIIAAFLLALAGSFFIEEEDPLSPPSLALGRAIAVLLAPH